MQAVRKPMLSPLSESECEQIHVSTLRLMTDMGVRFISPEALNIFRKAGFEITESNIVHFQPSDIAVALKTLPQDFIRQGLSPGFDVHLGGNRLVMGAGSLPLYIIEAQGKGRRNANLEDMIKFASLTDALEHIDIGNSVVLPQEVPTSVMPALWNLNSAVNMSKPSCCWYATSPQMAEDGLAVISAAAGGMEALALAKTWAITICPENPLTWGDSTYGLLEMAKHDVPLELVPTPVCGALAPATLAGALLLGNIETLSAAVLAQLVKPGCPVIYAPSYSGAMDMKLGAFCFGSPEMALQGAAFAQLGHWYGFPVNIMAGISDSKVLDEQAGYEKMQVLLLPALAGADCITQAAGLLDFALSASYEQMVIDDEICSQVQKIAGGIEVNEETLASSVIREVGPGGSFVGHEHTFRHFRNLWTPRLSDRSCYEVWNQAGREDIVQRASERVEQLLSEHRPIGISGARAEAAAATAAEICARENVDSSFIEKIMTAKLQ